MPTIYRFPDVYVEKQAPQPNVAIASSSVTTCALIGKAQRGERNKIVPISSWSEYIEKFAKDMNTPFVPEQSYLAYAVYGFFQNGGRNLNIVNATDGTEKPSVVSAGGIELEAIEAGDWGDNLFASVKTGTGEFEFIVSIYLGDTANEKTLKEEFKVINSKDEADTVFDVLNTSKFVKPKFAETYTLTETTDPVKFSGGTNGGTVDYSKVLELFNNNEDTTLINIVDDNTATTNKILRDYCTRNDQFIAVTGVESETTTPADVMRNYRGDGREATCYPSWGGIVDPITGETVNIPLVGHYMGWVVNSVSTYGISKVPAGVKAQLAGIVSLPVNLDSTTAGELNDNSIICIIDKKNYGICVWGGRTKLAGNEDEGSRYINSLMLETMIHRDLYDGLQPFLFEPNNASTWYRVSKSVRNYMLRLLNKGCFYSGVEAESFRVICDSTNNTTQSIVDRLINVDVMYREKGCAEFIVVRLSRSLSEI